jgi:hypothetical protein
LVGGERVRSVFPVCFVGVLYRPEDKDEGGSQKVFVWSLGGESKSKIKREGEMLYGRCSQTNFGWAKHLQGPLVGLMDQGLRIHGWSWAQHPKSLIWLGYFEIGQDKKEGS